MNMPHRLIPRRVRDRMGKRGLTLLLFGIAWLIQGIAVIIYGDIGSGLFWHERLSPVLLGAMWMTSAVLSAVAAFMKRHRNDTFGFIAVSSMPMLLAASYGIGAVTRVFLGDPMWLLGVLGFSVWGVITLALGVIASWPEVDEGGDLD